MLRDEQQHAPRAASREPVTKNISAAATLPAQANPAISVLLARRAVRGRPDDRQHQRRDDRRDRDDVDDQRAGARPRARAR